MYPNQRGGFGPRYNSANSFSGFQPRGPRGGGFTPENAGGNRPRYGPPRLQYRGGNSGRPPRPRMNFTQSNYNTPTNTQQRFNRPIHNTNMQYNTQKTHNAPYASSTSTSYASSGHDQAASQQSSDSYNDYHYDYDEESATADKQNNSYEEVPEYRQSSEEASFNAQEEFDVEDIEENVEFVTPDESNRIEPRSLLDMEFNEKEVQDVVPDSMNENQECEEEESDDDTGFCKYCKISFQTLGAYNAHIRGAQHAKNYIEAKDKSTARKQPNTESSTGTGSVAPNTQWKPYSSGGNTGTTNTTPNTNWKQSSTQPSTSTGSGKDTKTLSTDWKQPSTDDSTAQQPTSHEKPQSSYQAEPAKPPETQEQEEDEDSSDEEVDTSYCKYCKLNFQSAKAFHSHTRGMQHTTLVMEAKAAKGDKRFQKEVVPAEFLEVVVPKPQPVVEEENKNSFEIEDNWMNLDDETISYIKDRKNIKEKDLAPEECGKKVEDFKCPLCEIVCNGPAAFKSHIEGKSHKNRMQQAEQGVLLKKRKYPIETVAVPSRGRPSKLSKLIEGNPAPMLGLEYITEFQKSDIRQLARYVCNLCESKMDENAIITHIIGAKHRMSFLRVENPTMYEHLTKYSSKKRKTEINANCEDFAIDIEKEKGRGEVKVKIEISDDGDKIDLQESMLKVSKELNEKVQALEVRNSAKESDKPGSEKNEPYSKKPKYAGDHSSRSEPYSSRSDRRDREPGYREPDRGRGWGRGYERDWDRGREWDRSREWDRRRDLDRDRDWSRGREYDRARAWDRDRDRHLDVERDRYRGRWAEYDSMDERRLYDERRYLDSQMLDRYRLDDPYQERRRVDDILTRRQYIESLDQQRIDRVMEQRKQMEESDVDLQRLKRFTERKEATAAIPPAPSQAEKEIEDVNYRPSMEELMARRRQNREIADRLQERPKVQETLPEPDPVGTTPVEESLAKKVLSTKSVQEEVAKNPGVNVADLFEKLSSSMIASEDEAAMALQISSALSHALLTYRLQSQGNEPTSQFGNIGVNDKPNETPIPGLGVASSANGANVPSFLKTPVQPIVSAQTVSETIYPIPDPQTGPLASYVLPSMQSDSQMYSAQAGAQVLYMVPPAQTGSQVSYVQPPNTQAYVFPNTQTGQQVTNVIPNSQAAQQFSYGMPNIQTSQQMTNVIPNPQVSYVGPSPQVSYVGTSPQVSYVEPSPQVSYVGPNTQISSVSQSGLQTSQYNPYTSQAEYVSKTSQPAPVAQSVKTSTSSSSLIKNKEQPQKDLLESIRKQTELLKKKIKMATGGGSAKRQTASPVSGHNALPQGQFSKRQTASPVSRHNALPQGQFSNPPLPPQPPPPQPEYPHYQ